MGFEVREPGLAYGKNAFVLDNSVAMRWLVSSGSKAGQRYAGRVKDIIRGAAIAGCWYPYLWTYEAAHVISVYVRRGELSYNTGANTSAPCHDLCSVIVEREKPLALFEAAERFSISAYDAAYLLLALDEALPLATLDRKLRSVANKLGVSILANR